MSFCVNQVNQHSISHFRLKWTNLPFIITHIQSWHRILTILPPANFTHFSVRCNYSLTYHDWGFENLIKQNCQFRVTIYRSWRTIIYGEGALCFGSVTYLIAWNWTAINPRDWVSKPEFMLLFCNLGCYPINYHQSSCQRKGKITHLLWKIDEVPLPNFIFLNIMHTLPQICQALSAIILFILLFVDMFYHVYPYQFVLWPKLA